MNFFLDRLEQISRIHPIRAGIGGAAFNLLFDPGNSDFEKFIEIGGKDAEEFNALNQGLTWVLGLFQDPAVKLQPAEFAIQKVPCC